MAKKQIPGMIERFIAIRKQLNLNQKEFAQKTGCHRNRVSDIERGIRETPKQTFFALCTELNIDLNWFVTGKGAMFLNETHCQPSQSPEESGKQIELLGTLIEEKDKLLDEKDARIKLLEKILDI